MLPDHDHRGRIELAELQEDLSTVLYDFGSTHFLGTGQKLNSNLIEFVF